MEHNSNNLNILYLNWKNKEQVEAVSRLHMKLLPESVLSKLGFLFLSRFYYKILVKDKFIEVYLYKLKGEYVSFISCSNKPFTFMSEGIKKHFILISILLGVSIITNPRRLKVLLNMKSEFSKYSSKIDFLQREYDENVGGFLSFGALVTSGVLEYYRENINSIKDVSIPDVMMCLVLSHFKSNGKKCFFLMAIKTNFMAIKLYKKYLGSLPFIDDENESVVIKFDI